MNKTNLSQTVNATTIKNLDSFNTVISTSKINNIASTKINVTTIGIKGDRGADGSGAGLINRLDDTKGFKDIVVVDDELLSTHIYTDSGKLTKIFDITFTWDSGVMTKKVITEVSSSETVTYDFVYVGGVPETTIS